MPTKTKKTTRKVAASKAPATRKAAKVSPEKREARRELATAKLTELVEARTTAERMAEKKRHATFAGMLKAFDMGLKYEEIAEIVGCSKIRVSQILQEQRQLKAEK